MTTLRDLYRDNGADGDNVRYYVGRETAYEGTAWNPVYCVYGWPHLVHPQDPSTCWRCGAEKKAGASAV